MNKSPGGFRVETDAEAGSTRLQIERALVAHSGWYQVTVANVAGVISARARLVVIGASRPTPLSSSLCSFPLFSHKHSNSDLHSYANGSVHSFTIEQNEHFSFYMAEVTKIPKDKNTQIGILNHSIRNNL